SYWRAEIPSGVESIGGTAPLFEVLDRLAGTAHAWDRREQLIRIRDRKWYLDRPAEIPLRLVRRWVAVSDRRGALPVSEFAVAASTLTERQISSLVYSWYFPPQLYDLRESTGALEKARYLLPLHGTLAPAQQQSPDGVAAESLRGFFVGWPNAPSPETHRRLLERSDHFVLAVDGETGNVVGFITAITDGVLSAYIPHLEVLPAYQRRRIGTELTRRMLATLEGFYGIDLLCDPDVESFYVRLGMK